MNGRYHFGFLLRDIARGRIRSAITFVAAFLVGAVGILAIVLSQSTHAGLDQSQKRLGADAIVVSAQSSQGIDKTLLMDVPTDSRMSPSVAQQVAAIPGVLKVSSQTYLTSLAGAPCCPQKVVKIVVYDPNTDFAVTPWLKDRGLSGLGLDQAIAGSAVYPSEGSNAIKLYGTDVELMGKLSETGTALDSTVYITVETAKDIARASVERAIKPLKYDENQISAVLVKTVEGANVGDVAGAITSNIKEAKATGQTRVFSDLRAQARLLNIGILALAGAIALVAVTLVVVAAAFSARERRREIGVLRALGATRLRLLVSLTSSAAVLSFAGALVGTFATVGIIYLFRVAIGESSSVPLVLPVFGTLAPYFLLTTVGVFAVVTIASAVPLLRSASVDPAEQIRERT